MDKGSLISIITVNLNNLEGLKRTMKSVFDQNWKDFEYIIIDGGSTDGSKEFIEENKDKLNYFISEPDEGIYNAMNKGIRMASGQYLLFLNSGDELYNRNVLEENYKLLTGEDLIYFDIFLVFSKETRIHRYPGELKFSTFRDGAIGHPTTFIKSDLFDKVGFYDESLKIVADWKFFLMAIVKFGCSYKKVDKILSTFYMDGISSNNLELVEKERNSVLRENFSNLMINQHPPKERKVSKPRRLFYWLRSSFKRQ